MSALARLQSLLEYDRDSGAFSWRSNGKRAGWVDEKGYVRIEAEGRVYRAHRLALFFVNGEEPNGLVDHINGEKADNRLSNLRVVTNAENQQNVRRARRNSKSGFLGVVEAQGKFAAYIWVDGGQRYLGRFSTPELAHQRYIEAKKQLHKGYAS